MKCRSCFAIIWIGILVLLLSSAVYANSSWHWVTISPLTVLPFAVIFTLLIETILVVKLGKVSNNKKTFAIVSLANLLSFLAPYLERAYRFIPTSGGYSILAAFDKGPYYMILGGYLFLTITVELPIVYFLLRKESLNKKRLIVAILSSNILTTLLVAICERMICMGRW
ncbi:MAG: hypothetical protein PHC44_08665 [Lutispora sp.]|nr:hypothetical protein [Lutispora sp.]MDD4834789.1 hypothetical protein [Lutispora sp.]